MLAYAYLKLSELKRDRYIHYKAIPLSYLVLIICIFAAVFLSCSDSCFYSDCLICLILRCCLSWKTGFCYLNLNNSLPCSFSFLCDTGLFCTKSCQSIQKNLFDFFKKHLIFFNQSYIIRISRICLFSIITPY